MRYEITRYTGSTGRNVCTIDAISPAQALDLVDGYDEARGWPAVKSDDSTSEMRANPDDPDDAIAADPITED